MKRIFDLFLFLCLVPVLLFPILVIAVMVRLTSRGPALYWSDRVGVGNGIFKMPKFRTMRIDTPPVATHLLQNPDAYLTPIGPFLRKSSLDELPQLWSVLKGERLLIIGTGDAGEKMLREIRDNPRLNYEVVGFLDDDPKKRGMGIHGVKVLGSIPKIHDMAYRDEMDEILIATPSASAKQMRRIIEACEGTGLKSRTTPGIGELIDGKISFKTVREVSFEDLLGRDPVNLDMKSIGNYLADKVRLANEQDAPGIKSKLKEIIPEYQPYQP